MVNVNVSKHKRKINGKWRDVKKYDRIHRPKGKKKIVDKNIVLKSPTHDMYRVRDENGEYIGWKIKQ